MFEENWKYEIGIFTRPYPSNMTMLSKPNTNDNPMIHPAIPSLKFRIKFFHYTF